MLIQHALRLLTAAGIMIVAGMACAQNYPTRPVRIVTSAIGGSSDFIARLLTPV